MRLDANPDMLLKELFAEIQEQGYRGSYSTLSENMKRFGIRMKPQSSDNDYLPSNDIFWRPSKTLILFFKERKMLSDEEKELIAELSKKSKPIKEAYNLVSTFRNMMLKEHSSAHLKEWINATDKSEATEIAGFANGLLTDFKAVKNAFDLDWSNGPVEGNVNKLKTIKRQMYGRGSLGLLERRLVLTPT